MKKLWTKPWLPLLAVLSIILLLQALLSLTNLPLGGLRRLEWVFYDWRMSMGVRLNPPEGESPCAFVLIDPVSEKELAGGALGPKIVWPYSHRLHAYVVDELAGQGAKAIGFDVLFGEERKSVVSLDPEGMEPHEWLGQSIAQAGNVILAAARDEVVPPPILETNAWAVGDITHHADQDGVIRRVPPFYRDKSGQLRWHLGLALAARGMGLDLSRAEVGTKVIRIPGSNITVRIPRDRHGSLPILWRTSHENKHHSQASYITLLQLGMARREDPSLYKGLIFDLPDIGTRFKDKWVLIGSTVVGNNLTDRGSTPLSPSAPLVSLHANIAESVRTGDFVREVSFAGAAFLIITLGLLCGYLAIHLRLKLLLAVSIGYLLLAHLAFLLGGWMVPMVLPLAGSVGGVLGTMLFWRVGAEQSEQRRIREIFSHIVSPHVVQELLQAPSVFLGGSRRDVSILFADIRNFTEITDQQVNSGTEEAQVAQFTHDAAARELFDTVNLYLGTAADILKQHEGTLDKFIGDCVMAFWGAPTPQPLHSVRAVEAAIALQRTVKALNDDRIRQNARIELENKARLLTGQAPRSLLPILVLGAGISSGPSMVGLMGSARTLLNYTAFGREVNLASRLEKAAGCSRIFISESTFKSLVRLAPELATRCVAQEPIQLKGLQAKYSATKWHGNQSLREVCSRGLNNALIIAMRKVIYPGSFDPITHGHLDLIQRAAKLFDQVVVAVAQNEEKKPLFTLPERVELVKVAVQDIPNVTVDSFNGLLVNYVEKAGGHAILRGLRAVSDFEFEFQLALMNRKLNERVETIFMMPKETYTFLSSRIIKEIARLEGDVSSFVPAQVHAALMERLK